MKKISLYFAAIILVISSFSCKKEKAPQLEVTVVNDNNEAVPNVWLETSVDGANSGILNSQVVDSAFTDRFGKAFFKYDNTVLIDIALYMDQQSQVIIDSASVLLETKRVRGNTENVTEKKLVFR